MKHLHWPSQITPGVRPWLAFTAYWLVFILVTFGLPLAKLLLTGAVGQTTEYFTVIYGLPLAFLALGGLQGKKLLLLHGALILCGIVFLWLTYPKDPAMDFDREITSTALPLLGFCYLVGSTASGITRRRGGAQTKIGATGRNPD